MASMLDKKRPDEPPEAGTPFGQRAGDGQGDSPRQVTQAQKAVSAWIAMLALFLSVAFVVWLAITAWQPRFANYPDEGLPFVWSAAVWIMGQGTALNAIFATLFAVVAAGTSAIGQVYKRRGQLFAMALLCLAGVAAASVAMMKVSQPDNLATIIWFGNMEEDVAVRSVAWLFGGLIGWFSAFLGAQLGCASISPSGAIRQLFGGKPR